jgi:aminoglycoside phosphotransferase (APT) family kinase protein
MSDEPNLTTAELERLGQWMDTAVEGGKGEPITASFIKGGSQNEIFAIVRGDLRCALRRPPATAPDERDAGIVREWRIIEALQGSDVPHTAAVALCTDASVLGRTFYLMELLDAWSPIDAPGRWPAPYDDDVDLRRGLAFELVDGIAKLARVDWQAAGLDGFGRPDGFHDRQVPRWTAFLDRVRTRELPGLDEATSWLEGNRPLDFVPGIMHGDYQFANVMYEHGTPARLAAIIDWEMGTIGDPKIDLAWVVQGWPAPREDADTSYMDLTGMPSVQELCEAYALTSGRQVDDMDYYIILARWKLAIVLEQGYARSQRDPAADAKMAIFGNEVLRLMQRAADLAASTTYRHR